MLIFLRVSFFLSATQTFSKTNTVAKHSITTIQTFFLLNVVQVIAPINLLQQLKFLEYRDLKITCLKIVWFLLTRKAFDTIP